MSIILQAEKLYKEYKTSSGAVNALNGVDLSIEKGLFYAIIGRSGSGKSTLLHVLSGLDRPTSGKVLIGGVDMFSFSDEKNGNLSQTQHGLCVSAVQSAG